VDGGIVYVSNVRLEDVLRGPCRHFANTGASRTCLNAHHLDEVELECANDDVSTKKHRDVDMSRPSSCCSVGEPASYSSRDGPLTHLLLRQSRPTCPKMTGVIPCIRM